MFEQLGLDGWTPLGASVLLGAVLGVAFGVFAQRSRFCLRRSLVGSSAERADARGTWLTALLVAIAGTSALTALGYVDLSGHRYLASDMPILAIVLGGLMFGAGMVLTRGCASRLTVLAGSGNLRALTVILAFGVAAHATLKGVLAETRTSLGSVTVDLGNATSLSSLPGGTTFWSVLTVFVLAVAIWHARPTVTNAIYGALIGLLVPAGWLGTGLFLADEFDPIAVETLAFTSAASGTVFWVVASTAIAPTFGVGLLGGVLLGSFAASIASREFRIEGFTEELPTGRYLLGAVLMGVGGVFAGGCTVGAGLSGVSTLSVAAILALLSIIAGALGMKAATQARRSTRHAPALVPAE